jgi:hypothetical protein
VLPQVADLSAYAATHALTDKRHHDKKGFERLYQLCGPATSFVGHDDESAAEFEPLPSSLEARHADTMAA